VQNDCGCLAQTNWRRSIIIYNYKISFDLWAKKKNNFRIHYLIPFGLYTERHLNPYGWSTKYYSTCLLIGHSMPRPYAAPPQVRLSAPRTDRGALRNTVEVWRPPFPFFRRTGVLGAERFVQFASRIPHCWRPPRERHGPIAGWGLRTHQSARHPQLPCAADRVRDAHLHHPPLPAGSTPDKKKKRRRIRGRSI
jgi:hypothetical protein